MLYNVKKASLLTACSVTAFSAWAQIPARILSSLLLTVLNSRAALACTNHRCDPSGYRPLAVDLVNDVLRRLPGVDITQNGGSGSSHLFLFAVQMPVMCWC